MAKDIISLLFRALQSEFEAVQIYKEVANTSRELGKEELASNFDEIARDEMVHIGNLQELLKIHEPEQHKEFIEKMEQGFQEVEKEDNLPETSSVNYDDILKLLPSSVKAHVSSENTLIIEKSSLENPIKTLTELQIYRNKNKIDMNVQYNQDTIECSKISI